MRCDSALWTVQLRREIDRAEIGHARDAGDHAMRGLARPQSGMQPGRVHRSAQRVAARAVELAKRTDHDVLSMSDGMSKNMAAGAKTGDDPSVKAMENTEVSGVNPQGDRVELLVVIADRPEN